MTQANRMISPTPIAVTPYALLAALAVVVLVITIPVQVIILDERASGLTNIGGIAFALVGALLVRRRPENVVGWLLAAMGIFWAAGQASWVYVSLSVLGHVPRLDFAFWITMWAFWPHLPLVVWIVALFPGDRTVSTWMCWPLRAATAVAVVSVALRMLVPIEDEQQVVNGELIGNPWAIESLAPLEPLSLLLSYLMILFLVPAMVDLVLRWRRSSGVEQLQLRWLALGLVVFVSSLVAAVSIEMLAGVNVVSDIAWSLTWLFGLGGLPIAIGISIARYRLYEIDRIISRTLVYGLLTAGLVGTYFGLVVALQALLRPVSSGSDLAIVVTTLVVAALFLPARRRIQDVVDRRFNRRAYNAGRTIEVFNARLRQEVDLDALSRDLLAVVDETMQPEQVSLWLREPRTR